MRILHVIFSLNTGGSETLLVDIINEQVKTNHVELMIINNIANEHLINRIAKEIIIHHIKRVPGSLDPMKIIQFNLMMYQIKADVVHFHNHNAIKFLKYKIKAKTFLTIHTVNVPTINFRRYTALFAISEAVKTNIYQISGINSIRIYNGVNFHGIKPKICYSIGQSIFKIVQVSRLDHGVKGQHILLQALNVLVHRLGLQNIKLDFIGEGKSLNYLQGLVEQYNLTRFVNFLGMKDRTFIYNNLGEYDLLIQPSIQEGFGLTIVEAIAAGLPVIASDIDGPAEIIADMPGAWLFPLNHSASLAKAIQEVLNLYKSGDIERRCKLNYSAAISKFSVSETAHNYVEHYV